MESNGTPNSYAGDSPSSTSTMPMFSSSASVMPMSSGSSMMPISSVNAMPMSSSVHTLLPASCLGAPTEITSPQPPSNNFTSLPPPSHQMVSLSALPTSSSLSMAQSSPSLSTMPPSAGSLLTNQPSSLSALPPSSLSLPPPHFQPVLEPSLHYHPVQVETVQAGGDMKERRSSLTLGTQQQPASNPQHQLQNQQHFNMLQQPNIVQQLSALQQQQPAGAVTSAIDYTPLKVSFHLNCEKFITNGLFGVYCFCVELIITQRCVLGLL